MRHVLIVDDEEPVRKSCAAAFEPHTHVQLDQAGTIAEARQLLANKRYDVVICDGVLPDGSGDVLALELHNSGTPVVFISGSEKAPEGIIHLKKPFSLNDLLSVVGGYFR